MECISCWTKRNNQAIKCQWANRYTALEQPSAVGDYLSIRDLKLTNNCYSNVQHRKKITGRVDSKPRHGSFLTRNSSSATQPPPTLTITVLRRILTRRNFWDSPNCQSTVILITATLINWLMRWWWWWWWKHDSNAQYSRHTQLVKFTKLSFN